ncbi:hypothetical protein FHS18_005340 [Paenibacillus phyllosphaerae]|uniref:N-acetyltransferase domain-containing protein n=1 Tax=Paenibacillus phyllosphaerae TaxID=274593 RepID=A0A7W5B2W8_9BACL|nr:GNAT family N-acetyltransferase [Paenibacillus phyllosphaerae]MBB3113237.1 hypothetical protein [Paenibacillus phyllosphaerae]
MMIEREQTQTRPEEEIVAHKQGNSYVLQGVGGIVGEITYRLVDVDTWVIDHTFVDGYYRGRGLAKQLLDFVVEEARERGRKIIPSCSYALRQFEADPSYADVWAKEKPTSYSDSYSSDGVK